MQGRHGHQSLRVIFLTSRTKIFYFIRPTPANLAAYERWSGTELQSSIWLGDMVDEVVKVTLNAGNTMIIPTGWIHAVVSLIPFYHPALLQRNFQHTPMDSLVFGGNFLHSYNVGTRTFFPKHRPHIA